MSDVKRYNSGEVADDYLDAHEIVGDCELLWVRASDYDALEQRVKLLESDLSYTKGSEKLYHDEGTDLLAEVEALRESLREQEGLLQWSQENEIDILCGSAVEVRHYSNGGDSVVGVAKPTILAAVRALRERVEPQGEKWGDNWSGVI